MNSLSLGEYLYIKLSTTYACVYSVSDECDVKSTLFLMKQQLTNYRVETRVLLYSPSTLRLCCVELLNPVLKQYAVVSQLHATQQQPTQEKITTSTMIFLKVFHFVYFKFCPNCVAG